MLVYRVLHASTSVGYTIRLRDPHKLSFVTLSPLCPLCASTVNALLAAPSKDPHDLLSGDVAMTLSMTLLHIGRLAYYLLYRTLF